jgi:hypothetical protein
MHLWDGYRLPIRISATVEINRMRLTLIVSIALFILLPLSNLSATSGSTTITAIGDNYIRSKNSNKNSNYGSVLYTQIEGSTESRVLVQFDQAAISAALENKTLTSATLQLFVETNAGGWTVNTPMSVKRMTAPWTELGSTWNCAVDTNTGNNQANCVSQWNGGFFVQQATATFTHSNNQTGWIQADVMADIQAFLQGTQNDGWIVMKTNPANGGSVNYTSVQGTTAQRPKLVLNYDLPNTIPADKSD